MQLRDVLSHVKKLIKFSIFLFIIISIALIWFNSFAHTKIKAKAQEFDLEVKMGWAWPSLHEVKISDVQVFDKNKNNAKFKLLKINFTSQNIETGAGEVIYTDKRGKFITNVRNIKKIGEQIFIDMERILFENESFVINSKNTKIELNQKQIKSINSKELSIKTKKKEKSEEPRNLEKLFRIYEKVSKFKTEIESFSINSYGPAKISINPNESGISFKLLKECSKENPPKLVDLECTSIDSNIFLKLDEGEKIEFKTNAEIGPIKINHRVLSKETIDIPKFKIETTGHISLDGTILHTDNMLEFMKIKTPISFSKDKYLILFEIDLPETPCQNLLDSIPDGMNEKIKGIESDGKIKGKIKILYDYKNFGRLSKSDAWIQQKIDCSITKVPEELDTKRFRKTFKHKIYSSDGKPKEVIVGPGTSDWTPISEMSPYVELGVRLFEDPGFRKHGGIIFQALEGSLRDNLVFGKFIRGGSTITMQLAKNLWLNRNKNIARKLQELVLAKWLEQSLSKDQIIETYLNIIEYGPNLYGIGPASYYYFKKEPYQLSLSQSMFLASILPNPKSVKFVEGSELSQDRMLFLRMNMDVMGNRGWITEEELIKGKKEQPVYGKPGVNGKGSEDDDFIPSRDISPYEINDEEQVTPLGGFAQEK